MSRSLSAYPTLNDALFSEIGYSATEWSCSYVREGLVENLRFESADFADNLYKIVDDFGIWDPNSFNFTITRSYKLSFLQALFGVGGIACKNATLGIAVMWTSPDSNQRGAIKIAEFDKESNSIEHNFTFTFDVAQLRGSVNLSTVLYIEKIGKVLSEESYLANEYGCILGILDSFNFTVDGIGSLFPIYEENDPTSNLLWYMNADWEAPCEDAFIESFSVNINKSHPAYKSLNEESPQFNQFFSNEVIASALTNLIFKLKMTDDWECIIKGNGKKGSVAEAVYYFVSVLGVDITTVESISSSLRKIISERMNNDIK